MIRKIKRDKRAVSEVVSYVMLIAIVIGLSVLVYAFLKVQIPKAEKTCEDGISIVIRSIQCDNTNNRVIIEFQNKGLFGIDGVYIRFANNSLLTIGPKKLSIKAMKNMIKRYFLVGFSSIN